MARKIFESRIDNVLLTLLHEADGDKTVLQKVTRFSFSMEPVSFIAVHNRTLTSKLARKLLHLQLPSLNAININKTNRCSPL